MDRGGRGVCERKKPKETECSADENASEARGGGLEAHLGLLKMTELQVSLGAIAVEPGEKLVRESVGSPTDLRDAKGFVVMLDGCHVLPHFEGGIPFLLRVLDCHCRLNGGNRRRWRLAVFLHRPASLWGQSILACAVDVDPRAIAHSCAVAVERAIQLLGASAGEHVAPDVGASDALRFGGGCAARLLLRLALLIPCVLLHSPLHRLHLLLGRGVGRHDNVAHLARGRGRTAVSGPTRGKGGARRGGHCSNGANDSHPP
eukprot:scaffold18321_cov28-Tisochrysis_lutea.AAC.4